MPCPQCHVLLDDNIARWGFGGGGGGLCVCVCVGGGGMATHLQTFTSILYICT